MEIYKTDAFSDWLADLKDAIGKAKILGRIDRLKNGNPGKIDSVGRGVTEMKIDFGPGYRVYYVQQGKDRATLLKAGTKKTQDSDIKAAQAMAKEL
jgi:putative addiction module killer protein